MSASSSHRVRDRLLVAATDLFAARGIAVPVDDILQHAGVSIPSLYREFDGKPGLVAETLAWWSQAHLARMQAALQSATDPHRQLDSLIAWLADWFSRRDYHGSYVTNAAAEVQAAADLAESTRAKAAFKKARATIARHRQAERELLGELVKSAADPEALADQLQVVLDGAIEGAKLVPRAKRRAIAETTRDIALALLTQDSAPASASPSPKSD
jgi:AcrR family transcriptional regulator